MLSNIHVVLVETFHPGNIGSALRAINTMGLSTLVLVNPRQFPDSDVERMAASASDAMHTIQVMPSLEDAVAQCALVIGTSARRREYDWPLLTVRECGIKLVHEARKGPVALVFGSERNGLGNNDLQKCHFHAQVNAAHDYPTLNLAQAIQIFCYEIREAELHDHELLLSPLKHHPQHAQVELFYRILQETLYDIRFIIPQHPGDIMIKLRRLFNKAQLEKEGAKYFNGYFSKNKTARRSFIVR